MQLEAVQSKINESYTIARAELQGWADLQAKYNSIMYDLSSLQPQCERLRQECTQLT